MQRFSVRLFAAVMLFSPAALAEETPRAIVVVHVFNGAGVTESVLAEAGREVRKIFDEIGVRVSWEVTDAFRTTDPPLTIKTEARAAEVALNIIAKPMADFPSDVRRNPDTMGWSPGGKAVSRSLSYVFYQRIQDFVSQRSIFQAVYMLQTPRVLAYCIAHELGHLLIPANTHSKKGIMRGQLNWDDIGTTGFRKDEAQLMVAEIHRRIQTRNCETQPIH